MHTHLYTTHTHSYTHILHNTHIHTDTHTLHSHRCTHTPHTLTHTHTLLYYHASPWGELIWCRHHHLIMTGLSEALGFTYQILRSERQWKGVSRKDFKGPVFHVMMSLPPDVTSSCASQFTLTIDTQDTPVHLHFLWILHTAVSAV